MRNEQINKEIKAANEQLNKKHYKQFITQTNMIDMKESHFNILQTFMNKG